MADGPPSIEELIEKIDQPGKVALAGPEAPLIRELRHLCDVYGFGRVHQVMSWIESIWRYPKGDDPRVCAPGRRIRKKRR